MFPLTDRCLHDLIAAQAQRTPDLPAVAFEGERLTYRELDRRAELLAARLRAFGAGPETLVGLLVERSLETVVGIVGILKAGAAYVPIDAGAPPERIAYLLADARVACLVTESRLVAGLPAGVPPLVTLDQEEGTVAGAPTSADPLVRPDHLAYVIYTSGSTGKPKGVCIEHRQIVAYVRAICERLRFVPGMQHATVSTVAADLGHTVLFPALVTGGCVHVVSERRAEDPALLAEYFERERIDVLKIVPSHLAALQAGRGPERVMPRAHLILGGEASRLEWVARLRALAPGCAIHNHYGPTETTVGAMMYDVGSELPSTPTGTLPLGRPLPHARIHVLDEAGKPVAVGEQGELYVGGAGVGRGYWERPELTAEKFVPDPVDPGAGGRCYRTGDIARLLPDGTFEFCGRVDDQVKLHGYRVELGEIEGALREHRGVRDAVVRLHDDGTGEKRLVGYVVPQRGRQTLWDFTPLQLLPDGTAVAHLNPNETEYIYHEIFELQAYLRHGITIRDGDRVIDAGANIGLFTVFCSRFARDLHLLSFEPNPAAFACLKANAEAWGGDVRCFPFGLSDQERTAELTFFEGLSLLSGFHADPATEREVVQRYVLNQAADAPRSDAFLADVEAVIDDRMKAQRVTARLRTLSSVIQDEGLDRIDLLKINVEKSEREVLGGLAPDDWPKVRQMVIEVDQRADLDPIVALLEAHGFETVVEQDPLLRQTDLCYVFAIRPASDGTSRLIREAPAGEASRAVLPPDGEVLAPATLRAYLKARVPAYMIPSAFVLLDKLPLTANGKIDRHALPVPPPTTSLPGRASDRPLTTTELGLAAIWADLLGVGQVAPGDDFFDLGGRSLLAIKAIARIRDAFAVDLPTTALFDHPTLGALAQAVDASCGARPDVSRILPRRDHGPSALSFAQEQLWFLDRLAPGSPAYHIVDVIPFATYDASALRRALEELVRRHEMLRTVFDERDGHPRQTVLPAVDLSLAELDLERFPAAERDAEWRRVVREDGRRPFDLARAPLFRGTIVHLAPGEHRLLLTIHHVIADEWSMELIQREVEQLYQAFTRGGPSPLPELSIQYGDFAAWQRERSTEAGRRAELDYWTHTLAGAPTVLELPADRPRPAVQSFRGATESFALPRKLVAQLTALGRQEQATLFMVLEAGLAALLQRYTGQDDLLIGTPISRRTHSQTESLIGCFLNTVVLRSQFTDELTFRGLLRQARDRAQGAYAHADLPFNVLVADLAPDRDASRTPLFQVMFVLHDAKGVSQVSQVSGNRQLETGTSKFDLTLVVSESVDGLDAMVEYSTDLFDAGTIQRFCHHYAALLEALTAAPDLRLAAAPLVTAEERWELLTAWNDTAIEFVEGSLGVHELVAVRAARAPDRIAVEGEGRTLTYGELDRDADRLARQLTALCVGPDVRVGVLVERSPEMVVALLGILKAGGAYVPLDPAFPAARLAHMVEDSGMKVLVTHRGLDATLTVRPPNLLRLEELPDAADAPAGRDPAASPTDAHQLAYVLYTSGSTGVPKGVEITHGALVNFLLSMQRSPGFTSVDTLLAVTTLSFDIAGLELYLPLISGGTVVIAGREEVRDPVRLAERIRGSGCTVMQATPATWEALIEAGWTGGKKLRLLCGGEAMSTHLAEALRARCGELWNMYGPTETTVWSTIERVTAADAPPAIGRPIANTQVYVLDRRGELVPPGIVGELHIGGVGVARGYLGREELTRERFVPNPYAPGGRLYRTGDRARWLPDGRLHCLGRNDHQVKVRGFRIEPGEIEAVLARDPRVRESVVVAREFGAGDRRLVAYVVAPAPPADLVDALRGAIRASLPEYMMPAEFVLLAELPRTANGKLDRAALPAPTHPSTEPASEAGPRTPTQAMVKAAFDAVLGRGDFGVEESFFDLGGTSLMAARLISRLRDGSGVDLPLRNLFEHPTVAGLAEVVDGLTWVARVPTMTGGAGAREELVL